MKLNTEFNPFPTISTNRLSLRTYTLDDKHDLFALRTDVRVMKYLDRPKFNTIQESEELIQKILDDVTNNKGISWSISLANTRQHIGSIGFWKIIPEHFRAEIGYMLHPDFQGQGIMQEALKAAVDYGFNQMNLHSIEANVNPNNQASIKLLKKSGFIREAYYKENYYFEGNFFDSAIYSLLNK
ncbi:MAG: GNAT family N-acetyltransferase [Bacteroidota bacterium]|nr:GNAT family N-acetyltransferase [Bacteroidota bacterium]